MLVNLLEVPLESLIYYCRGMQFVMQVPLIFGHWVSPKLARMN